MLLALPANLKIEKSAIERKLELEGEGGRDSCIVKLGGEGS